MKDREFLIWIYTRMHEVHGESEIVDYMHKFRAIIGSTDPEVTTPNTGTSNSLKEFLEQAEFSDTEYVTGN